MSAVLEPTVPDQVEAEPFEPGIRDDLPAHRYHSIEALSASGIKRILQSPMHYRYDREHPKEPTDSMAMGTALHLAVLEPDRYAAEVAVMPDFNRRTNAGKADYAAWIEQHQGFVVLTSDQVAQVEGMAAAVKRHPIYGELMTEGRAEVSLQWRDARFQDQVPCKARFDWLREDGIGIDLKSCQDASPEGFSRAVAKFLYHLQAAWYNNGHEHLLDRSLQAFIFVAVESSAPYGCAAYVLQANALRFGADQCERAMLLYAQARKSGYWRGYPETVSPLILPRWALSIPTPEY